MYVYHLFLFCPPAARETAHNIGGGGVEWLSFVVKGLQTHVGG
jgi:hypothetical protein